MSLPPGWSLLFILSLRQATHILNAKSCHPKHTIRSIPVGEYIRTKRACSKVDSLHHNLNRLDSRLIDQGYKQWHIRNAQYKTESPSRESLLFNEKNPKDTESITLVFSIPYSSNFNAIKQIFHRYLPILNRDEKLKDILKSGCRCVAKWGKSLGSLLLPSTFD